MFFFAFQFRWKIILIQHNKACLQRVRYLLFHADYIGVLLWSNRMWTISIWRKSLLTKVFVWKKKFIIGVNEMRSILSALTVSHANTFTQNLAKYQLFTRWIVMQFHVCSHFMRKLNDRLDDDIQSFLSVHCWFEISILGRVIPCSELIIIIIYKKFAFNVVQA